MANYNKVILLGNLTRDPELRFTQSGMAIAKFGMAINRTYTVNGERKETTCFVDLTAWGKQAETINQYVTKGRPLFVEGRLDYQQWEDKQTGQKRNKIEVVVENFQFVGGREGAGAGGGGGDGGGRSAPSGQRGGQQNAGGGQQEAGGEADFDGIPF